MHSLGIERTEKRTVSTPYSSVLDLNSRAGTPHQRKYKKKQCSPIFPLTDSLTPQDTPADGCAEYRTRADACLW